MSTIMNVPHGEIGHQLGVDITPQLFGEQEICNIRPLERSGYTTPTYSGIYGRRMQETKKCYPQVSLGYEAAVEMCRKKLIESLSEDDEAVLELSTWRWLSCFYGKNESYVCETIDLLKSCKVLFPIISYHDLIELASSVAFTLLGVPDVSFHPGRKDNDEPSNSREGFLPHAAFAQTGKVIRDGWSSNVFPKTRQLSDKEFLIFYGGQYNLLGANDDHGVGIVGPRTSNPRIDNSYYKELSNRRKERHLLSEVDKIFLDDPVLLFLVLKYAADQHAYLADFARAFMNLSEFGFADA